MPFPTPLPGLVIRYSYLWASEADAGQEEGIKNRPCAVILVARTVENQERVYVLPITHSRPPIHRWPWRFPKAPNAALGWIRNARGSF